MSSEVLQRPESLQKQIQRILTNRILQGVYESGELIPSENQLAEEFNVSRATIRAAVTALDARGLIFRRQGVGSYVGKSASISNPIGEFVDFLDLIASSGFEPGVQIGRAYKAEADLELARNLEIDLGDPVLQVELKFTADDNPVIFCLNSIPAWVMDEALTQEVIEHPELTEPIYEFTGVRCGQPVTYHTAALWADLVENFDIPIDGFQPKAPVLVVRSIGCSHDNHPIFQSLTAYPDKRMQFKLLRQ
jgi:GntR family transcriptional regulator